MGSVLSRSDQPRDSVAYRNFLTVYRNQHKQMSSNDALLSASREWGTLSQAQRNRYANMDSPKRGTKNITENAAARRKITKKNSRSKRISQRRIQDKGSAYKPLTLNRSYVIRKSLVPSRGFLNLVQFFQEIHSEMPRSLAVKEAVSSWCAMNADQRGIFISDL
uniref:Transition protein-like 94D, isoform B n=1 Tax=Drosophila melanogaster TaxID=7227 RepID=A0A0B4KHN9_DROME|nr:transition protein-like 94D, isoform B [Drosophila melanogaster]AGB96234.1 transition protein-like 94D, isoform B [Drosophila melanogaster]|eukprot:NP_001262854.1 transition protein-like 94D, isoform B [Drosophila melanogaster]